MFEGVKDAWFFSKVATFVRNEFGVDLIKGDKATEGLVRKFAKEAKAQGFTLEEAACSCIAVFSLELAKMLNLEGQSPDYRKMHAIEDKITRLSASGAIREPILDQIEETVSKYYRVMEDKTGVPNDYPE